MVWIADRGMDPPTIDAPVGGLMTPCLPNPNQGPNQGTLVPLERITMKAARQIHAKSAAAQVMTRPPGGLPRSLMLSTVHADNTLTSTVHADTHICADTHSHADTHISHISHWQAPCTLTRTFALTHTVMLTRTFRSVTGTVMLTRTVMLTMHITR